MGKKFFTYLAALAAALTVHSANQPGGGGGP